MKRERGSAIHRILDILDTVAAAGKPISATEINEVLDLPKATAHRLCSELEARGYLLKNINGKNYIPGNRWHKMAIGVMTHSQFRAQRHAILQRLSRKVGETCNIAYVDGLRMAYSDRVETELALKLTFPIETRVPLHCTASGKLYLSSLSEKKCKAVIEKLDLSRQTSNTITDPDLLMAEIKSIKSRQFSIDNEELFEGMIAIGVPITDAEDRFYSSLAIQAPVFRFSLNDAKASVPLLREAVVDLSALIDE